MTANNNIKMAEDTRHIITDDKETIHEKDEPPGHEGAWGDWKWQLRNSIRSIKELSRIFSFTSEEIERLNKIVVKYPLTITPYYLSLIDRNNPRDPIRLQSVPAIDEDSLYFDVQDDPLGEEKDTALPGLVHRYPDRVLLTLTDMCPVYCRHCTRKREWCRGSWVRTKEDLQNIYAYIAQHKEVRDVILSGGDPFALSTAKIEDVLRNLRQIHHVEIIRIGTRCPVVLPQRINDELVSMLKRYRPLWVNTHFNHPNEITKESSRACDKILCAGIPVNNQSVLLKGINDDTETMIKLCQGLLKIGIRPYYMFQCDPVSGTGHFRTSVEKGLEIIKGMRGHTSGLAVPTFIVDGLNGQGKVPLQPNYIESVEKDYFVFRGYKGDLFKYYNPEEISGDRNSLQFKG
ncbi:MAG: KamA family radical SAM protein [Candidatus Omnitrophica bacterium]|nr:KamA family radical SAM protein [Candidatus Omnitrophota bacterium]